MKTLLIAVAALALGACAQAPRLPESAIDERGRQLALEVLTIDTHIDVPYRLYRNTSEDVSRSTDSGDFDFPRAKAGGLDALFMSVYIPAAVDEAGEGREFAEDLIDGVRNLTETYPEEFAFATCTTDLLDAKARGLVAMPLGMENGGPLEGDLENLDYFRERGIRYITLTHSKSNHISDSSYDDNERWGGLSPFGKQLIPAMNERGVLIDVSHISDAAFWQVIELSRMPVVATHSSLRHFTPGFHRNMSDDMVRALGRNGGIIHINYGSAFLTPEANAYSAQRAAAYEELLAQPGVDEDDPRLQNFDDYYREQNPYPYADIEDVLDHIDRAVRLAGIDHVGLGSDYDGVGDTLPTGLKDVSTYPALAAGLLRRGYSETDIAKIFGGNFMRLWSDAEIYAAQSGYSPDCHL